MGCFQFIIYCRNPHIHWLLRISHANPNRITIYFATSLVFVLIPGCKSDLPQTLHHKPLCIGHGGMGIKSTKPLNGKSSILECIKTGADGVEIDIQLSADNVLYAYHDADLSTSTNGTGNIHSRRSDEIDQLHYTGLWIQKSNIARLDSIAEWLSDFPEAQITLDIKLYSQQPHQTYLQEFARSLNNFLNNHSTKRIIFVESQDTTFLNTLRLLSPNTPTYYYASVFKEGWEAITKFNYTGLTMDFENISIHEINQLQAAGYKISVWNVQNGVQNSKAIDMHPDGIQTDELKDLLKKVKS